MRSEEALKKLLAFNIANYSLVVDTAASLREVENYLAIVEALTNTNLDNLWIEWMKAVDEYRIQVGWKEAWKRCAKIRAELFKIMSQKNLVEITSELLNIDKIRFGTLDNLEDG